MAVVFSKYSCSSWTRFVAALAVCATKVIVTVADELLRTTKVFVDRLCRTSNQCSRAASSCAGKLRSRESPKSMSDALAGVVLVNSANTFPATARFFKVEIKMLWALASVSLPVQVAMLPHSIECCGCRTAACIKPPNPPPCLSMINKRARIADARNAPPCTASRTIVTSHPGGLALSVSKTLNVCWAKALLPRVTFGGKAARMAVMIA